MRLASNLVRLQVQEYHTHTECYQMNAISVHSLIWKGWLPPATQVSSTPSPTRTSTREGEMVAFAGTGTGRRERGKAEGGGGGGGEREE